MRGLGALSVLFLSSSLHAAERTRVLLISIDGLRPDAVTPALAPNLSRMISTGSHTLQARSLLPTYTIPNHVSMLTGLTPATHKVLEISDPGDRVVSDTVIEIAHRAGLTSAIYISKSKLRLLAKPGAHDRYVVTNDADSGPLVQILLADLAQPASRWDLTFVLLADPDTVGHLSGWMSTRYLAAVTKVDGYVGDILSALQGAGLAEQTMVVVTSDHGGLGNDHAVDVPEVTMIPWIATGPGIPAGLVLERTLTTADNAPTVLRALGLATPVWMEGTAVEEVVPLRLPWFRRGDANVDGASDATDAMLAIDYLFLGGRPECAAALDTDADGKVRITDVIYLLGHLFFAAQAPPPPYPDCGTPPDLPGLSCRRECR